MSLVQKLKDEIRKVALVGALVLAKVVLVLEHVPSTARD